MLARTIINVLADWDREAAETLLQDVVDDAAMIVLKEARKKSPQYLRAMLHEIENDDPEGAHQLRELFYTNNILQRPKMQQIEWDFGDIS